MQNQNLRSTLIQHFIQNQKNIQLNDTITLLAMIGIETVIQECQVLNNKNELFEDIEYIKEQLRYLNENVQIKIQSPTNSQIEKSISCQQLERKQSMPKPYEDNSKQKTRPLTPKITEVSAPSYRKEQEPKFFTRHHLDDKLMKEALSQSYYEPIDSKQTKYQISKSPHTIKKNENIDQKKLKTPKTVQSIQYFLGQDELKKWHPNRQNTQKPQRYNNFSKVKTEISSKRTVTEQDDALQDLIQQKYELVKKEALMKYMEQLQLDKRTNLLQASDTFSLQPQNNKVFDQFDQVPIEDITSFNQDMIPQQFFSSQNDLNIPLIKITPQASYSPNFQSNRQIKHQTQQSQVSNRSNGNTNNNANNILNIANSLLNSPIIRQISIKQTNSSSLVIIFIIISMDQSDQNEQQKVKFVKLEGTQREMDGRHSVQVSGFDPTSPHQSQELIVQDQDSNFFHQLNMGEQDNFDETNQTSNSSAFSLFKPNEELRSFFQKEFNKNNQFYNTDQSSEAFQNTLMQKQAEFFGVKRILAHSNGNHVELQKMKDSLSESQIYRNPNEGNSMFLSNGNLNNKVSNIFLKGRLGGASKIF